MSIVSIEQAYQRSNVSEEYASFRILKEAGGLGKRQSLGTMIPAYSLLWIPATGTARSFTVLAFPRDTRPGYLNTFAVTDDDPKDTVRVYNPRNGYDFYDIRAWDPIL